MTRSEPLRALFLNCSLKRSCEASHTQLLMDVAGAILEKQGVAVESIRLADHDIPPGVQKDMRDHGFATDDWPDIQAKVMAARILVIGTPIWLGERSSIASSAIERLYGWSGELNDKGQSSYYGRVGGCIVTGNEDGIKHCAMVILYALQHLGYTVPPQADAGWIGEAGPGPSYGDVLESGVRAGIANDFTQRNTTFMAWNLLHMARLLQQADGLPAEGNDRRAWKAGERFDHPNPEYRS